MAARCLRRGFNKNVSVRRSCSCTFPPKKMRTSIPHPFLKFWFVVGCSRRKINTTGITSHQLLITSSRDDAPTDCVQCGIAVGAINFFHSVAVLSRRTRPVSCTYEECFVRWENKMNLKQIAVCQIRIRVQSHYRIREMEEKVLNEMYGDRRNSFN